MSGRIERRFQELKNAGRAALAPFVMGYDPDRKTSQEILNALPAAGADLIELGIPFSDPMADGPVIQEAGKRALEAGATLRGILDMVRTFRENDDATPMILMGYYNPVYRYGVKAFCRDAVSVGVDGIILVDLPPEEEAEFVPYADKEGLTLVRLIAPTTDDSRLKLLMKSARGYLYYIAVKGITGAKSAGADELRHAVQRLKSQSDLPVAIGFGIRSKAQVAEAGAIADAVVVGSALVQTISEAAPGQAPAKAAEFLRSLKS